MADQLRPVFPPDDPNYSPAALAASYAALDPETQAVLATDRARLSQTSAAALLMLSEILSFSPDTTAELVEKLPRRLRDMSPVYHEYVNKLLGNTVVVLSAHAHGSPVVAESGSQTSGFAERLEIAQPEINMAHVDPTTPKDDPEQEDMPDDADETLGQTDLQIIEVASTDALAQTDDHESDFILTLPDNLTFYKHPNKNKFQVKFLKEIFPEKSEEIDQCSSEALALLGWQVTEYYKEAHIPRAKVAKKDIQRTRLELALGLYDDFMTQQEIANRTGLNDGAAVSLALTRMGKILHESLVGSGEQYVKRAVISAKQPDILERFSTTGSTEALKKTQAPEHDPRTPADVPQPAEAIALRKLYDHYRGIPAGMKNFLYACFPKDAATDIEKLTPVQASVLTEKLIAMYRNILEERNTDSAVLQERVLTLERATGLYDNAMEVYEIAGRRNKTSQTIRGYIDSAIEKIRAKIPSAELLVELKGIANINTAELRERVK